MLNNLTLENTKKFLNLLTNSLKRKGVVKISENKVLINNHIIHFLLMEKICLLSSVEIKQDKRFKYENNEDITYQEYYQYTSFLKMYFGIKNLINKIKNVKITKIEDKMKTNIHIDTMYNEVAKTLNLKPSLKEPYKFSCPDCSYIELFLNPNTGKVHIKYKLMKMVIGEQLFKLNLLNNLSKEEFLSLMAKSYKLYLELFKQKGGNFWF